MKNLPIYLPICLSILAGCFPSGPVPVPQSDRCDPGIYPLQCTRVPIRSGATDAVVDAILEDGEYYGASELPISNLRHHDGRGRAFVSLDATAHRLRVFLDDVTISDDTTEISVFIDSNRFHQVAANLPDRRYTVDLHTNGLRVDTAEADASDWRPGTVPSGFEAVAICEGGQQGTKLTCDVEYRIPLFAADLLPPGEGLLPGIGFAVSDSYRDVVFPEELAEGDDTSLLNRYAYVTLLFGRPESIPFSFMSWNLAHWDTSLEWDITQSDLENANLGHMADVMFEQDIVTVQEMWNREHAKELLRLVNNRREDAGLPPAYLYGPAASSEDFLESIGIRIGGDPQAGLFVYSRFRALDHSNEVFNDCRGEDCLKPKGIQWVRLALDPEVPTDCYKDPRDPNPNCGLTPTSEMFIDVFNTHTQADDDELCTSIDLTGDLPPPVRVLLLGTCTAFFPPGTCETLIAGLHAADVFCGGAGPQEVRTRNLRQLARFVDRVTEGGNGQPVLIAGDLNVRGRTITGELYGEMLKDLGISSNDETHEDLISPFPDAFDWDIDHADVAREDELLYRWTECGIGTSIGDGVDGDGNSDGRTPEGQRSQEAAELACFMVPCGRSSDSRLDYVFVRPPAGNSPAGYMITRPEGSGVGENGRYTPLWQVRWPASLPSPFEHLCSPAKPEWRSSRVSDHRPIVVDLELAILRQPGRYHPEWAHQVVSRVTTADLSEEEDCSLSLCGATDPYVVPVASHFLPDGTEESLDVGGARSYCDDTDAGVASWPVDACTSDWQVQSEVYQPGEYTRYELAWQLFEYDSGIAGGDEEFFTIAPTEGAARDDHPNFQVLWSTSEFDISTRLDDDASPPGWSGETPILSTDPIRWCTGNGSPSICVRTDILEVSQ